MTCVSRIFSNLALFVLLLFLFPLVAEATATGAHENGFAAEIFGDEASAPFFSGDQLEVETSPSGPLLLLFGVILLAASGRQYSQQFSFANTELTAIREGLDCLSEEAVNIDGTHYEKLASRLDGLKKQRQTLVAELQQMNGGHT